MIADIYGGIVAGGQGVVNFPATFASNQMFQIVFEPGSGRPADFDASGAVDVADLASILATWAKWPTARRRTSMRTGSSTVRISGA